ncbi:MAG: hypothetical protein H3C47_14750 [Candidatus Cloacimonetes bacterium]|nr:hypothetical protein [Candidatus Cloacimonadota bacterium]
MQHSTHDPGWAGWKTALLVGLLWFLNLNLNPQTLREEVKVVTENVATTPAKVAVTVSEMHKLMTELRQQGFDPDGEDISRLLSGVDKFVEFSGISRQTLLGAMQRGLRIGVEHGINPFSMAKTSVRLEVASQTANFDGTNLFFAWGREGIVRIAENLLINLSKDSGHLLGSFIQLKKQGRQPDSDNMFQMKSQLSRNLRHGLPVDYLGFISEGDNFDKESTEFIKYWKERNLAFLQNYLSTAGVKFLAQAAFFRLLAKQEENSKKFRVW